MSSTDISLIYVGPITRHGYLKLSDLLEKQASSDKFSNNLFENILMRLRNAGLGTEIAARVASDMACGFVSPITKQIDPIEYGEYNRALAVTLEYGARLKEKFRNIDAKSIARLTYAYNSHSFVIDKKEAMTLFKRVKSPDEGEKQLEKTIRERTNDFNNFPSTPLIESFSLCHKTTSMNKENS